MKKTKAKKDTLQPTELDAKAMAALIGGSLEELHNEWKTAIDMLEDCGVVPVPVPRHLSILPDGTVMTFHENGDITLVHTNYDELIHNKGDKNISELWNDDASAIYIEMDALRREKGTQGWMRESQFSDYVKERLSYSPLLIKHTIEILESAASFLRLTTAHYMMIKATRSAECKEITEELQARLTASKLHGKEC